MDRDLLAGNLVVCDNQQLGALTESADDSVMAISSHQHHSRAITTHSIAATSSSSMAISEAPRGAVDSDYNTERPYVGSLSDAHLSHRPLVFRPLETNISALSENRIASGAYSPSQRFIEATSQSSIGSAVSKQASTQSLADYKKTLNEVSRHLNSTQHRRAAARRRFFTEQSGGGVTSGYMSTSPTPPTSYVPKYSATNYSIATASRSFDQTSIGSSGGASSSALSAVGSYTASRAFSSAVPSGAYSSYRSSSAAASYLKSMPDYTEVCCLLYFQTDRM